MRHSSASASSSTLLSLSFLCCRCLPAPAWWGPVRLPPAAGQADEPCRISSTSQWLHLVLHVSHLLFIFRFIKVVLHPNPGLRILLSSETSLPVCSGKTVAFWRGLGWAQKKTLPQSQRKEWGGLSALGCLLCPVPWSWGRHSRLLHRQWPSVSLAACVMRWAWSTGPWSTFCQWGAQKTAVLEWGAHSGRRPRDEVSSPSVSWGRHVL